MAEGVEPTGHSAGLDEEVAPGSGGAEVASAEGFAKPDNEVGQFLHGPATVCVPAAPLRTNPLIRRKHTSVVSPISNPTILLVVVIVISIVVVFPI